MRTIADMMGVPGSERVAATLAGDAVIGRADPAFGDPADPIGTMIRARDHLHALGADLARHRRAHPSDDLLTNLVDAEVDGQRLSDDEIGSFMVLFTVAGNDTTRNTTSLSTVAFGGQQIAQGDKVCMFYCSGNRDESVFDRPSEFDVSRPKNPHVGFGGGGPHFCVGAGLARSRLRAITGELLTHVPDIEVGEPEFAAGNFIRVVTRLPAHVP